MVLGMRFCARHRGPPLGIVVNCSRCRGPPLGLVSSLRLLAIRPKWLKRLQICMAKSYRKIWRLPRFWKIFSRLVQDRALFFFFIVVFFALAASLVIFSQQLLVIVNGFGDPSKYILSYQKQCYFHLSRHYFFIFVLLYYVKFLLISNYFNSIAFLKGKFFWHGAMNHWGEKLLT